MSGQELNVEKLDVQEAKKASYGVDAEAADPTGVQADRKSTRLNSSH